MANKNIANLGAIAVPLAGTEVIPIWGGTTTTKVTVANLTAGRAVATGDLTTIGTAIISSDAAIGTVTPRTSANKKLLTIDAAWGGQVDIGVGGASHAQFGSDNYDSGYSCRVQSADGIIFKTSGGTTRIYMDSGNIIPANAAKGINFTANTPAAGMTSQLLNWYEEGTWTTTLTPATSGTISIDANYNTLAYTKIGRIVHINGALVIGSVASPVGATINFTTLPFTSASTLPELAGLSGASYIFLDSSLSYAASVIPLTIASSSTTASVKQDASTVAAGDQIYMSFSYIAS